MNYADAIIPGVLGGLTATLIAMTFREFWLHRVIPWYEDRIYKDARIEGRWISHTKAADGTQRESLLEVMQVGHRITGTVTNTRGDTAGKTYRFQGELRNLILTLAYTATDRREIDRGTVTLHLLDNGRRLQGYMSYYSNTKNAILTAEYDAEPEA